MLPQAYPLQCIPQPLNAGEGLQNCSQHYSGNKNEHINLTLDKQL